MCIDICVDMRVGMCIDMCANMCLDMRMDMCIAMCTGICMDMWIAMRIDKCVDICMDMLYRTVYGNLYVYGHVCRQSCEVTWMLTRCRDEQTAMDLEPTRMYIHMSI